MFIKFTQTEMQQKTYDQENTFIPDSIISMISVSSRDFVEFVQQLSILYDGDIPLNIIQRLTIFTPGRTIKGEVFDINDINFSELGEEFVRSLIEIQSKEDIKFLIAQKAVKEGMSPELYKLTNSQLMNREMFAVETIWLLLKK